MQLQSDIPLRETEKKNEKQIANGKIARSI